MNDTKLCPVCQEPAVLERYTVLRAGALYDAVLFRCPNVAKRKRCHWALAKKARPGAHPAHVEEVRVET